MENLLPGEKSNSSPKTGKITELPCDLTIIAYRTEHEIIKYLELRKCFMTKQND